MLVFLQLNQFFISWQDGDATPYPGHMLTLPLSLSLTGRRQRNGLNIMAVTIKSANNTKHKYAASGSKASSCCRDSCWLLQEAALQLTKAKVSALKLSDCQISKLSNWRNKCHKLNYTFAHLHL